MGLKYHEDALSKLKRFHGIECHEDAMSKLKRFYGIELSWRCNAQIKK